MWRGFCRVPYGLVKSLEQQGTGVEIRRGGDNTHAFGDDFSKVEVKADNQAIRQILTDFLPLKGYNPKIWLAETRVEDGKPITIVQYYGTRYADGAYR